MSIILSLKKPLVIFNAVDRLFLTALKKDGRGADNNGPVSRPCLLRVILFHLNHKNRGANKNSRQKPAIVINIFIQKINPVNSGAFL